MNEEIESELRRLADRAIAINAPVTMQVAKTAATEQDLMGFEHRHRFVSLEFQEVLGYNISQWHVELRPDNSSTGTASGVRSFEDGRDAGRIADHGVTMPPFTFNVSPET